jgi:hypothetical protein
VLTSTVTPADLGAPVAGTRQASGAGGPSCEIDTAPVTMGDTVQPASVALAASSPGYLTNNGVPLSAQDLVEELKADGDCPAGLSTAAGRHAGRPTLTGLCGNDLGSYSGVKVYFFDGFSVAVTTTWAIRAGHRTQADVDAVADRVFDRLQQTA